MPPNHFESEVESFLEGSHGDRTHIKRADHHTVTPLCGTLLLSVSTVAVHGRAMVMAVSRWPASVPVEGARVSYVHCLNVGLGCSVGGGPPN